MTEPGRRIAVTGAFGYVGAGLVRRLQKEGAVEAVLAIDVQPAAETPGSKVTYLPHDIARPLPEAFTENAIDTVVHLAYVLRPDRERKAARRVNVGGAANVLDACAEARVGRVIYLSSTSVYGAHADNPPMLTEDSPLRPARGFQYSEDKVEAEGLFRGFAERNPAVAVAILRGCPVLGPNADNSIARAFLRRFLVAARGNDPPLQLIHEDDLTDILTHCCLAGASGVYNVAGSGVIRWREMVRILGRPLLTLPPAPLCWAATVAWWLRLQSDSPPSGLSYIRYPWTASTEKTERELGMSPRYSSRETVEAFMARRSDIRRGSPA